MFALKPAVRYSMRYDVCEVVRREGMDVKSIGLLIEIKCCKERVRGRIRTGPVVFWARLTKRWN